MIFSSIHRDYLHWDKLYVICICYVFHYFIILPFFFAILFFFCFITEKLNWYISECGRICLDRENSRYHTRCFLYWLCSHKRSRRQDGRKNGWQINLWSRSVSDCCSDCDKSFRRLLGSGTIPSCASCRRIYWGKRSFSFEIHKTIANISPLLHM